MTESENRFHQFKSGFLGPQSWQGRLDSLQPLVRLPIYGTWRQSIGAKNHSADYYRIISDSLWIKAFEGIDLQHHLSDVKARLDRQHTAFEQVNAGHDFLAELEQIFRKAGKLDEES